MRGVRKKSPAPVADIEGHASGQASMAEEISQLRAVIREQAAEIKVLRAMARANRILEAMDDETAEEWLRRGETTIPPRGGTA